MLEQKIDALIIAINALRETMEGKPAAVAKEPAKTKPPKTETPEPAKEAAPEIMNPNILRDELQELCLATVRKDRSKKEKIVKVIADFGAELIKDVDETKLPELKKALEAL